MKAFPKYLAIAITIVFAIFVLIDIFQNFIFVPEPSDIDYLSGREKSTPPERGVVSTPEKGLMPVYGEKIVKTAYLQLESSDLKKAVRNIEATVKKNKGIVVSEEITGGEFPRAFLTVTVPEEKYEVVLNKLRSDFEVISFNSNIQDVTEEYFNLESELKIAKEELSAYEKLLKEAKTVEEIIKVREKLKELKPLILQLEQRLKQINESASYSMISITIETPQAVSGERNWWRTTLKEAVLVLQRSFRKTILVFVGLIPVFFAGIIVYYLTYGALKLLKR